jgi:hypothetical protein
LLFCVSKQAFRPSTVDLGPVSKAQVKAITMEETAGISALDLDLDLTLDFDLGDLQHKT